MRVAAMGRATLEGLRDGGVVGIVKHRPGDGRAKVDSHVDLPVVYASAEELEIDLAPFRTLAWAPMAMTSHIVYKAWDAERPATLSPIVIEEVIRGRIGFDGLLMTDDIDMKALSGSAGEQAAAAVAAGCDVAQIGRASCRERVCQYGSRSVVAVRLKKDKRRTEIGTREQN